MNAGSAAETDACSVAVGTLIMGARLPCLRRTPNLLHVPSLTLSQILLVLLPVHAVPFANHWSRSRPCDKPCPPRFEPRLGVPLKARSESPVHTWQAGKLMARGGFEPPSPESLLKQALSPLSYPAGRMLPHRTDPRNN